MARRISTNQMGSTCGDETTHSWLCEAFKTNARAEVKASLRWHPEPSFEKPLPAGPDFSLHHKMWRWGSVEAFYSLDTSYFKVDLYLVLQFYEREVLHQTLSQRNRGDCYAVVPRAASSNYHRLLRVFHMLHSSLLILLNIFLKGTEILKRSMHLQHVDIRGHSGNNGLCHTVPTKPYQTWQHLAGGASIR